MPIKTAATNQSISTDNDSSSSSSSSSTAVTGDSGEITSPVTPPSARARGSDDRPKRKKMLSFVPKAEKSAIDSTAANRVRQGSHEESRRSQKARDGDGKDVFRAHASEVVQLTLTTAEDYDDAPKKRDEFLYDMDDLDEESQEGTISQKYDDDLQIIRATNKYYFFTGLLVVVMCCLVGVVVGWPTHLDESDSIFSKRPCDVYDQDYCVVRLLVLLLLGVWMIVVVLSVVVGMRREVV